MTLNFDLQDELPAYVLRDFSYSAQRGCGDIVKLSRSYDNNSQNAYLKSPGYLSQFIFETFWYVFTFVMLQNSSKTGHINNSELKLQQHMSNKVRFEQRSENDDIAKFIDIFENLPR